MLTVFKSLSSNKRHVFQVTAFEDAAFKRGNTVSVLIFKVETLFTGLVEEES